MRHPILLTIFLLGLALPAQAQEKDDPPPPSGELKGNFKVFLETGGHYHPIVFAGFRKGDKELVTVGKDGSIQIWDVATGKRVKKLLMPVANWVNSLAALSPDDRTVAAQIAGGLLLMNINDGRVIVLKGIDARAALGFSPEGDQLAGITFTNGLYVWPNMDRLWDKAHAMSIKDREQFLAPRKYEKKPYGNVVQFSPDGKQILIGHHGLPALLCDATPGGEKKEPVALQFPKKGWPKSGAFAVAWAEDGKSFFTAHTGKNGVGRWDTEGKPQLKKPYTWTKPIAMDQKAEWLGKSTKIEQIWPLDADNLLLSGIVEPGDNGVFSGYVGAAVLNLNSGELSNRFKEPELAEDKSLTALSQDKKLAVTTVHGGRDLVFWQVADGKEVRRIETAAQTPVRVGWLKDKNRHVLALGYGADPADEKFGKFTRAFDLDKLELVDDIDPAQYSGRLHEVGKWSAAYKDKDNHHAVVVKADGNSQNFKGGGNITAFTFVPRAQGENPLFVREYSNSLRLFDLPSKDSDAGKPFGGHSPHIHDLAPSPDGKCLAIATGIQQIAICSLEGKYPRLLELFFTGQDWIVLPHAGGGGPLSGHYAASPGGEKMMGWVVSDGFKTQGIFHPASHFRKQFYRPDVVKLILEEGSFKKALDAANKALKDKGGKVQEEVDLEDLQPPSGFIDSVDTSQLPAITVHVQAFAAHVKEPITKMELLADGKALFGKAGVKEFKMDHHMVKTTFQVELPPGSHKLMVRISTPKRSSLSTEANVSYAPPEPLKLPKAKLHILAFGVSQYAKAPKLDLDYPAKDAEAVADAFKARCGLPLFAPGGACQVRTGKAATTAAIYDAVQELPKITKPEDVAIIFFAGHGLKDPNGGLFLLSHDADLDALDKTAVSGSKVRDALAKVPCRVILILESCHSGALGPKAKPVSDDLTRELTDDDCGVVVWCSAMGNEKAGIDTKAGHGLFTLSLLKALDEKQGAEPNKYDGRVYLHHLQTFVFDYVQKESAKHQHPSLNIPWTIESFALFQPLQKK